MSLYLITYASVVNPYYISVCFPVICLVPTFFRISFLSVMFFFMYICLTCEVVLRFYRVISILLFIQPSYFKNYSYFVLVFTCFFFTILCGFAFRLQFHLFFDCKFVPLVETWSAIERERVNLSSTNCISMKLLATFYAQVLEKHEFFKIANQ